MKTTIATLVLISLMITTTGWAGTDSTRAKVPEAVTFNARISNIQDDVLQFRIINPGKDKVILKVYSDRNVKVMHYNIGRKEAVHLSFLMENMRKTTYTAVVERNNEEVLRKSVVLK